jgi:hypothetical protein
MRPYLHHDLFMWNLHASVGRHAQNSVQADIAYLQWYYTLAATFVHREGDSAPEERKAFYRKVKVTGACSGRDDDPLVQAIMAHQRGLSHPIIDGKMTPVPGSTGGQLIAGKAYFVIRLGARLAEMFPNVWPRLDLVPGCPPLVATAVREAVPRLT